MSVILGIRAAAEFLGVERSWLKDAPIARMDFRKIGGERAVWRWDKKDLENFLKERRVLPGQINHQCM